VRVNTLQIYSKSRILGVLAKVKLQISRGLREFVLQNESSQSFASSVLVRAQVSTSTNAISHRADNPLRTVTRSASVTSIIEEDRTALCLLKAE